MPGPAGLPGARGPALPGIRDASYSPLPSVMPTFLFKTEPGEYAFADLMRDKATTWAGVSNPAACGHLRACAWGDDVLIYHTGSERAIVGLARVVKGPTPDPDAPGLTAKGEIKRPVVEIRGVRPLPRPVTLEWIKADARFHAFDLVRQSRLSVMPVSPELDRAIREAGGLG